jgi:hypothetical protein
MGILAGTRDTALALGRSGLEFAKANPGKAAIGAGAAGALGYMAYKSVAPGFQPPVDQSQATQIELTSQRGQGLGSAQPAGGIQYRQNPPSQDQRWQQQNQIPYIDTLALKKEQLRLYKEKETLSNDLALNQLYSTVAANPGVVR